MINDGEGQSWMGDRQMTEKLKMIDNGDDTKSGMTDNGQWQTPMNDIRGVAR